MCATASADYSVRPAPPGWVMRLLHQESLGDIADSALVDSGDFTLAFARIPDAASLDALDLQRCTVHAYESLAASLAPRSARYPVRFWNFIPSLNERLGDGLDRYMVFNAGRFAAFTKWYGAPPELTRQVATASGVGHFGDDLLIWCLAARQPGRPVENPAQQPSYTYSPRYGPLPPCFARAMIVKAPHGTSMLLVGGTASIRGEESTGIGQLPRQTLIALQNLAIVAKAACVTTDRGPLTVNGDSCTWLARYRHLRVYHARREDRAALQRLITPRFPNVSDVEWLHAPLCRPELLVEIEGVAAMEEG
jgi:chorismate lyase / 3-hydroxybenzoate synthase